MSRCVQAHTCSRTRAMSSTDVASGISFKTQALYVTVFVMRYLDLIWGPYVSLYNSIMKIFFIGSSCYILFLMKFRFRCVPLPLASSPAKSLTRLQTNT